MIRSKRMNVNFDLLRSLPFHILLTIMNLSRAQVSHWGAIDEKGSSARQRQIRGICPGNMPSAIGAIAVYLLSLHYQNHRMKQAKKAKSTCKWFISVHGILYVRIRGDGLF